MKIFVSSVIGGFEAYRHSAKEAISSLRHEPVMAESFGALATSPQVACLQGLRSADLVILILGARYGYPQGDSGVAPTHEEFLEAREGKPILMFVQSGVEREPEQAKFIDEVGGWQGGGFRDTFATPEELRSKIVGAVHQYELAKAAGAVDSTGLVAKATALLPRSGRGEPSATLSVAFTGGPAQGILRPSALEAPALLKELLQRALFGDIAIFEQTRGNDSEVRNNKLVIEQERGALVQLGEDGSMLFRLPLSRGDDRRRGGMGGFAIIEEDVTRELGAAIWFAAQTWESIDPTQRLTHMALAARIDGGNFLGWRTREQDDASPNSGQLRMGGDDDQPVTAERLRGALRFDPATLAEDVMVRLRRLRKI